MSVVKIHEQLADLGHHNDDEINLLETAFLLAELQHIGISTDKYRQHIFAMEHSVGVRFKNLLNAGADDDGLTRLAALKHVMADEHGYNGDTETYDDIQNADLFRVIDRRKGLPISLAVIAITLGRAQGWIVDGINFPGHFLVRLTHHTTQIIFDPFANFKIMQAHDLRALAKQIMGEKAELSSNFYDVASSRLILLRLQNNIKARQIDSEDYSSALDTVITMRLFAPNEYRLLFDEAVLRVKQGEAKRAITLLQSYLLIAERPQDINDAEQLLRSLRDTLN
jgi:regulator of sirC expression with transglutaminase-like and TPR domain